LGVVVTPSGVGMVVPVNAYATGFHTPFWRRNPKWAIGSGSSSGPSLI
jgi:hypothetical protein